MIISSGKPDLGEKTRDCTETGTRLHMLQHLARRVRLPWQV